MTTSTIVKVGALAVAAIVARTTYSAINRRRAEKRYEDSLPKPVEATRAGVPADVFSQHAVQRDLSVGDPV